MTATRVICYCRVSTQDQADHGVSLEAQEARLRTYAAATGATLVAVEVDAGISAATMNRPALQRALAAIKARKADVLVVVSLSRLSRSVRDVSALVATHFSKRASLVSLGENIDTGTSSGKLMLHLLASVSEWERSACGERTSAAMSHLRGQGIYVGGSVKYGSKVVDGRIVAREDELATVARARALREAGLSLAAVAGTLAEQGIYQRNGRPFAPTQLARMLAP